MICDSSYRYTAKEDTFPKLLTQIASPVNKKRVEYQLIMFHRANNCMRFVVTEERFAIDFLGRVSKKQVLRLAFLYDVYLIWVYTELSGGGESLAMMEVALNRYLPGRNAMLANEFYVKLVISIQFL